MSRSSGVVSLVGRDEAEKTESASLVTDLERSLLLLAMGQTPLAGSGVAVRGSLDEDRAPGTED